MENNTGKINGVRNRNDSGALEIDLYQLLLRLLDRWFIIGLSAFICAVLALAYTGIMITPTYKASAKLYVVNSKDSAINLSDLQISNYLANDYKEVFKTWHVHESVLEKLNLNYTYAQLGGMIEVTNPADTRILVITATSTDPQEARDLANTYADVAREFISVKMDTSAPTVFEEALLPSAPSAPNKTKNVMVGFLLGGLLACGIIALKFILDDYIRTPEDVEKYLELPTLGTILYQPETRRKVTPKTKAAASVKKPGTVQTAKGGADK